MREIIFEFTNMGRFVKVTAMDSDSLTEVTIVGDPIRGEDALRNTARRKLEYVIERDRQGRQRTF